LWQLASIWRIEIAAADLVLDRLELRLNFPNESQMSCLAIGVVRLAGHRDIALDTFLANARVELASGDNPALAFTPASDRFVHQPTVPGLDLLPGRELDVFRQPLVGKALEMVRAQHDPPSSNRRKTAARPAVMPRHDRSLAFCASNRHGSFCCGMACSLW